MVREFIEGWDLLQVLGEGTFAEVKLLVNRDTGEACAMKEINIKEDSRAEKTAKKEICVHKLLKHPNIVQCYGSRIESERQFIFLEYCSGGELFDRIEPEIGMPEHQAHYYFRQLISAVNYLHHRGVAHRDIKPENLLLTDNDILKLSDFGMATVFRHQGKERLLERRCGTTAYCAPEILLKPQYNAEPADLWSCGIVLVAMVTGELPWNQATLDIPDYSNWKDGNIERSAHWQRIQDNLLLSLIKKILGHSPSKRYTILQVKNHLWFKKKFKDSDGSLIEPELVETSSPPRKAFRGHYDEYRDREQMFDLRTPLVERLCASQPAEVFRKLTRAPSINTQHSGSEQNFNGFTQPAQLSDLVLSGSGSTQATQGTQTQFQRLVKRMTRFWVKNSQEDTDKFLQALLEKMQYNFRCKPKGVFTITTQDRRGAILSFRCTLIQVDHQILVDFRLSKGCGIEFKRHFAKLKTNCASIIEKGPVCFPSLIAANAIPGTL